MAYNKRTWKDREVQRPWTFNKVDNADGTITLTRAEGTIIEPGTPITAEVMNNIETGIEEAINGVESKAPLASPAFTGTPTAPTQARTNKSTRIATTAFVHSMYHSATVTIDTTGWTAVTGKGNYKFKKDIAVTGCTVKSDARLNYTIESKSVALGAKADYIETEANKVVVYAEKVPTAAMTASLFVYLGV